MNLTMQPDSPSTTQKVINRGFAQAGVRIGNERVVLALIGLNPGSSNADLARLSGLGPQTTSRIVADLEARDLVLRGEVLRGRRGQPATPMYLNPEGAFTIGVEIGWRHVEVLLFSMGGQTLASIRRSYDWPDAQTIIALVAAEIATVRAGMSQEHASRLMGIGVSSPNGVPGIIMRLGATADDAEKWDGFDLVERLERASGLPVQWYNDGTAACWSELIAQPPPRMQNLAFFQVSTLVGAGVVVKGDLWQGPEGDAADLGSVLVTDDGEPTFVHLVASILALEQRLLKYGIAIPKGNPLDWDWTTLEPVASNWLQSSGRAIAAAIMSTKAFITLDVVVVDGVMPRLIVERLVVQVQHHLEALPLFSGQRPRVEMGRNGASASAMGAAQLVLYNRYFARGMQVFNA